MATQPMAWCVANETPVSDGLITYQMNNVPQFRLQSSASRSAFYTSALLQLASIHVLLAFQNMDCSAVAKCNYKSARLHTVSPMACIADMS